MKVLTYAMIAVCALCSSVNAVDFNIMVIGDSIAAGLHGTPGRDNWRQELFDDLDGGIMPSTYDAKFIGPSDYEDGPDGLDHVCFRGAKISNMTGTMVTATPQSNTTGDLVSGVSGWGNSTWDPDLVIIQIGINDVKQLQTGAGNGTWTTQNETDFFDDLNDLIDEVATRHPSADIFVCNLTRVIGCATNTLTCQEATDVNAGVNAVNAAMLTSALSSNADLVIDIQSVVYPLTETMPNDGIHPNSYGLDDIGYEIASEMKDYYLW